MRGQHHTVEVHLVDAKHIQRPLQVVAQERVVADGVPGLADQLDGLVDIGVVGELHREKRIGELPRLVGHGLDLPERHRVHEALAIAQAQGTDGQAFDGAGMPGIEHHPVTDGQGVFDDDEQPGDHVLHQLLRAETDRQADDPGTCQERCDVDPQVGHGGDRANHHQDDFDRVAQQRQDGFHPRTRLARRALVGWRFQGFLNRRVEHHPDHPGHQQDQTDVAQGITDRPAHGIGHREFEQRHAPDPPEDIDEHDGHGDAQQGM
ncbi:hypothetical protein D3C75_616970 [compost metagenome]